MKAVAVVTAMAVLSGAAAGSVTAGGSLGASTEGASLEAGAPVPPAPVPGPPVDPAPPVPMPTLTAGRVGGPLATWQSFAGRLEFVGGPTGSIPASMAAGILPRSPGPRGVLAVRIAGMVRAPTCIRCSGFEAFLLNHVGGRLSAFLQRGSCGPTPPRVDATHRPLVQSLDLIQRTRLPYVDIPPGEYAATVTVPLRGLPTGTYRTCTWLDVRSDLPVSNPVLDLDPAAVSAARLGGGITYGVRGPIPGARTLRIR